MAMGAFIYVHDAFIPIDLTLDRMVELFEEGSLFKAIEGVVEHYVGGVKGVRLYGSYFNPASGVAVVEYMVEAREGEVGVKVVYAEDPAKALTEYYEAERGV